MADVSFIKGRLRRIEGSLASRKGPSGRCPGCGLRPQDKGCIVVEDNDPVPDLPEVCPECGRNTRIHIVVVYEDEEVAEGEGASVGHEM